MKVILIILLAVVGFVLVNIEIDSLNPCSSFSRNPSYCSSDKIRD